MSLESPTLALASGASIETLSKMQNIHVLLSLVGGAVATSLCMAAQSDISMAPLSPSFTAI